MVKQRPASRKKAVKPRGKGKRTAKRQSRSAGKIGTTGVAIVQGDAGRSLDLRVELGMTRKRFAGLVPMSPRNLAYLESGKRPTRPLLRHVRSLRRLIDALTEVMPDETVGRWLLKPNKAFGGQQPIDVIERGEADRVWEMIFRLRSNAAS